MLPFVFLCVAALPLPPDVDAGLFPDADSHPAEEVQLAGLAALYPGRILRTPPLVNDGNAARAPMIRDLPRDITYIRVYDLGASLPEIIKNLSKPSVILDLRYVTADEKTSKGLADALSKAGLASAPVQGIGTIANPEALPTPSDADKDHPAPVVLAMVNEKTAGPLEAWLEAFQEKESVLAVGTPTAGQPAEFKAEAGHAGYYIITGELRPEGGSIVGTGLQPRFLVEVTPQQNYLAYARVEHGTVDVANMLRHERAAAPAAPAATTGTPAQQQSAAAAVEAGDVVLQRAVDVVAALQVLGRLPSSKDTGAAKAPSTATAPPVTR